MGTKSKWLKGKLTFYNNAVVEENVGKYTAVNASIPPYGLRVIASTADSKPMLSGGPAIGQEIEIVCNSTFVTTVRVSTAAGGVTIAHTESTAHNIYGVTVTCGGSTAFSHPGVAKLRGITTSQWALVTGYSTSAGGCTLSTAFA